MYNLQQEICSHFSKLQQMWEPSRPGCIGLLLVDTLMMPTVMALPLHQVMFVRGRVTKKNSEDMSSTEGRGSDRPAGCPHFFLENDQEALKHKKT